MAIISHKLIKSRQSFPSFFFLLMCNPPGIYHLGGGGSVSQAPSSYLGRLDYTQFQSGVLMFNLIFVPSILVISHSSHLGECTLASTPLVNRPKQPIEKGQSWHARAKGVNFIISRPLHPAIFENETSLAPP